MKGYYVKDGHLYEAGLFGDIDLGEVEADATGTVLSTTEFGENYEVELDGMTGEPVRLRRIYGDDVEECDLDSDGLADPTYYCEDDDDDEDEE